ncbi:hypothetical protein [Methyloceanibacter sp.]|uniref:hypothetical protein n=1 Tax=Methyloceanibacter sp. TaxID=1965321 RepID=UPI003D6D652F
MFLFGLVLVGLATFTSVWTQQTMLDSIDDWIKTVDKHELKSVDADGRLDALKLSYGKPRARLATKYQTASFAFFLLGCLFTIVYIAVKATP